ncbi:uncharacterized protein [Clytia hemisphaerica]|uniref:DSBA-like thioredoxin domain-containing protein n=1 Tax=Clytia hemisphaerica TaxID=252671 RepID=A0A7M5V3P3_9CNID
MSADGNNFVEFKIVVTADVTCPWCYISRKNLSAACANLAKQYNFVVQFKPFILDPNVPPGGIPWHDQVAMKQGEKAAKQEMKGNGPISRAGKSIGIKFDPERYVVHSLKSHLLLQFAREYQGPQKETELYYLICQQYFEEALNINSDKVLQSLAAQVGLNPEHALNYFTSEDNIKKLYGEIQKTKKRGLLGIPLFQISIVGFNDAKPLQIGGQDKSGFTEIFNKMLRDYNKQMKSKK